MPEPSEPVPAPDPAAKISNRARVIYPESGLTKGDLADYYAAVAPLMLPFMAGRPISLIRCPQGRAKPCFFQKHAGAAFGPAVHHVPITEQDGGTEDYFYLSDTAGILACVQMGTVEFHGWAARADAVEAPERMVFDLDPDEGLPFAEVRRAAHEIRRKLAKSGLASFALLSGGKGIHVVVPLDNPARATARATGGETGWAKGHDWTAHAGFAHSFADALAQDEPERFVATMRKARRKGRIFVDWLRNQRGSTAVMPYSARAREGAPVAVPVGWDELDAIDSAHPFTIRDAAELLRRAQGKALRGWGCAEQRLPAA